MAFKPGQSGNPDGRPVGAVNKFTRSVREALQDAFDRMQEPLDPDAILDGDQGVHTSLYEWGVRNPDDFYKLCGRLIPAKVEHEGAMSLQVVTGVPRSDDGDGSDLA